MTTDKQAEQLTDPLTVRLVTSQKFQEKAGRDVGEQFAYNEAHHVTALFRAALEKEKGAKEPRLIDVAIAESRLVHNFARKLKTRFKRHQVVSLTINDAVRQTERYIEGAEAYVESVALEKIEAEREAEAEEAARKELAELEAKQKEADRLAEIKLQQEKDRERKKREEIEAEKRRIKAAEKLRIEKEEARAKQEEADRIAREKAKAELDAEEAEGGESGGGEGDPPSETDDVPAAEPITQKQYNETLLTNLGMDSDDVAPFNDAGLTSVAQLETFLKSRKLKSINGVGPAREGAMLKAIELLKSRIKE